MAGEMRLAGPGVALGAVHDRLFLRGPLFSRFLVFY